MQKFPFKSVHTHYKQLLSDVRKKDTLLYSSLNDAISAIQAAENESNKAISSSAVEQMIKPLDLLVQQKYTKAYQSLLSIFQVLAAAGLLSFSHKVAFLDTALKLLESGDDMVPIKVVQVLLIMITRVDIVKMPMASKILTLCLKAFGSKSQIIKNNVFAVLRQMYSLLFEQYAAEHKAQTAKKPGNIEGTELHKICYEQIEQLITVAGDRYKYTSFKGLGMDIITVILAETQGLLASSQQIVGLFEKAYTPCLRNYLINEINSFPIITRAVKSTTQLILTMQVSYSLLQPLLSISSSPHSWHRYLALESFCTLFSEYKQIQLMHGMLNNVSNMRLLGDLVNAIVTITPKLPDKSSDDGSARLNLTRANKVHEISEAVACEPPIPTSSQYLSLLSETLANFVENLEELFTAEKIRIGEPAVQPFTLRQTEQAVDILDYTWKPIHLMLEYILKESDDEMQVQQTLHDIQSLINMTGSVGLGTALQSILGNLCSWELPSDLNEKTWETGYKHIYVCNAIFNIAQCLHKILDHKAWIHIFGSLQKITACVHRAEGDIPGQESELIHFNVLARKVAENVARYLPKGIPTERFKDSERNSELSAGTGEVGAQSVPVPFPTKEEDKESEDASSPFKTPSLPEEDDKDIHIQQIHRFGIKTATAPTGERKRELTETSPKLLVPPDASINFYRLNSMLVKREDSSPQLGRTKELMTGGKKMPRIGNLHSEVESMKTSLESLFVFTSLFDDTTLHEFVMALGYVTISSLETLPSAGAKVVEIKDMKKLNLFGLTKMLETSIANVFRIHYIWDYIAAHLEFLAKSKFIQLRPLAINAMTCLIINVFDHRKEKMEEGLKVPKWQGNQWQAVVLTPLMNSVLGGHNECIREVVLSLRHIIENCGPYIAKEGWEVVLCIIEKVISPVSSSTSPEANERIEQAFKCIEHISHNSLHKIHVSNIASLVAIIYYFTTLRNNLNTSLLAVAFIHNVADYICQQQHSGKLADLSEEKINEIWLNLLNKLKEIGSDERGELRHAAYRTLDQIMVAHAESLPLRIWSYTLLDVAGHLLQFVKIHYFACTRGGAYLADLGIGGVAATPKFVEGEAKKPKAMKFDEETIAKNKEEQKVREKTWEESVTVLHSSLVRVIKKLYCLEDADTMKERQELTDKAWSLLLESWLELSKNSSYEILTVIYKSIQLIITKCSHCVYRKFEETWKIFLESVDWIIKDKPDTHIHARPLVVKLTPSIIDSFRAIFCPEVAKEHEAVVSEKMQVSLYGLLKKILSAISVLEGLHGMTNPIKLVTEEKLVFDFIEYLPTVFTRPELHNAYFDFLLDFLNFRMEDPHSDGFIRRALSIIKNFIIVHGLEISLLKKLLPQLYPKFASIISLRFQNDTCKMLLFNAKDAQPLWYDVGEFFVHISTYLVNPRLYKGTVTGSEEGKEQPSHGEINNAELEKNSEEILKDKELQDLAWEYIIKLIKEILRISDSSLNTLDRALVEEVIKKSQELDITLINFILKVLLPSSGNLSKESQQELINLIDNGCTAFNTTLSNASSHSRAGDTLSKFCISTLIGLCSSNDPCEEEFVSVKQKIATITTPVLVNRCKAIFHKYMADEKRSGQVPLPRNRKVDLIELLSKLRTISIFPNALPKREGGIADLLASGKAHLIYLMPEIVECISSKEADLRDAIKEALQEINRMLLGELADLKKLPDLK